MSWKNDPGTVGHNFMWDQPKGTFDWGVMHDNATIRTTSDLDIHQTAPLSRIGA